MYNPQNVAGAFAQDKVIQLFGLTVADISDSGRFPDLVSADGSFYVEVKGSAYDNGGVVKERQLHRFDKNIITRKFYAFLYHSVRNMQKTYPEESQALAALDLRSLFLFPFSIVQAHLNNSRKVKQKSGNYVQLREGLARKIFEGDGSAWEQLTLAVENYQMTQLHQRVFLVTRGNNLSQEVSDSFHEELM